MRAEIIRADEVKVGDRILSLSGIYEIKRIDVIHGCGTRQFYTISGAKLVKHDDDLIARIEPETVEVREFWRVTFVRYRRPDDGTGYNPERLKSSDDRDTVINLLYDHDFTDAIIEHIRETVLSREEVKP